MTHFEELPHFEGLPRSYAQFAVYGAVFLIPAIFALLFAGYTNFIWEDWLIAYRSSVNLVSGHGLVYDRERVQSFTFPLGVLVPSAIAWLGGDVTPSAVIWPFRILQAALLGMTALSLDALFRRLVLGFWPRALGLGLLALNTKTISSTMGGMETGFVLLFIAGALYALFVSRRPARLLLGVSAAGLMWSRPDGFVYLVAICFGAFLFPSALNEPRSRRALVRDYALAAMIAAALYVPWLIWAQLYFGSFVPLTAQAKGLGFHVSDKLDFRVLFFPFTSLLRGGWTNFDQTFSPPYVEASYLDGSWPGILSWSSRGMTWVCCFAWIWPALRGSTRALSVAVLVSSCYLTFGIPYAMPWYFPSVALLCIATLALLVADAGTWLRGLAVRRRRPVLVWAMPACVAGFLVASLFVTLLYAYSARLEQRIVHDQELKQVGLWLQRNAALGSDTVFVEPLGYIGFYSNLHMFGWPGLNSPELVAARQQTHCLGKDDCFATLISYLQPTWVVLRPSEIEQVMRDRPSLLIQDYAVAKCFDVSREIAAYSFLPGRQVLNTDATLVVFRRQATQLEGL